MKIKFFPFFLIAFIILSCGNDNIISSPKNADLQLKFYTPADIWEKTFPLGNGRIGMMPDGGVATDHIVLNDITMWSGSEEDALNPDAVNYLPQIRQLLLEGKNVEAQTSCTNTLTVKERIGTRKRKRCTLRLFPDVGRFIYPPNISHYGYRKRLHSHIEFIGCRCHNHFLERRFTNNPGIPGFTLR